MKKEIKVVDLVDYPDAKKHQLISFVKSGIRIAGYLALLVINVPYMWVPVGVLVISEVIGIVEELV